MWPFLDALNILNFPGEAPRKLFQRIHDRESQRSWFLGHRWALLTEQHEHNQQVCSNLLVLHLSAAFSELLKAQSSARSMLELFLAAAPSPSMKQRQALRALCSPLSWHLLQPCPGGGDSSKGLHCHTALPAVLHCFSSQHRPSRELSLDLTSAWSFRFCS